MNFFLFFFLHFNISEIEMCLKIEGIFKIILIRVCSFLLSFLKYIYTLINVLPSTTMQVSENKHLFSVISPMSRMVSSIEKALKSYWMSEYSRYSISFVSFSDFSLLESSVRLLHSGHGSWIISFKILKTIFHRFLTFSIVVKKCGVI